MSLLIPFVSKMKLFKKEGNTLRHALKLYLSDAWNQLDALCVIMYVISVSLELVNTKLTLNAARYKLFPDGEERMSTVI